MARWLARAVAMAALVSLVGCAAPTNTGNSAGSIGSVMRTEDTAEVATTPASVTSYLVALRNGDLEGALASTDASGDSPAGADTAENVYRFLGTGRIRLQDWQVVGATAGDDGGQWVFVLCQLALANGEGGEVPLAFHTNEQGKIVFVG